jgi:hypothetical protein
VSVDNTLRQYLPLLHRVSLSGLTPLHRVSQQTVYSKDDVYALLVALTDVECSYNSTELLQSANTTQIHALRLTLLGMLLLRSRHASQRIDSSTIFDKSTDV